MQQNKPVPAESIVEKDGRRYREVPVRSALPLWAAAAVWILAALFLPMYSLWHLLLIAAASAAAAFLCARLLPKETRLVYLPTTRKLSAKYAELCAQNAPGENITGTAAAIEEALAQINTSFHRQFDALYADDALDISTDITVLDTLLARDGLK